MSCQERVKKTLKKLEAFLADPANDDLIEFTQGGISTCYIILDRVNPHTGNKFGGFGIDLLAVGATIEAVDKEIPCDWDPDRICTHDGFPTMVPNGHGGNRLYSCIACSVTRGAIALESIDSLIKNIDKFLIEKTQSDKLRKP